MLEGDERSFSRVPPLAFAAALSLLMTVVFFREIVFSDRIFADRDTLIAYMPMHRYWAERILSGQWPDWYPYDGLGQPYAGAMYGMAFHPIKLLFLLTDVGTAMKWATLLCFPLAMTGMFLLCRGLKLDWRSALMGGTLFAFNGYMASMTNSLSYLLAMASLPWCWWLTVRIFQRPSFGRVALAAFSYALMLFVGEAQSFIAACALGALWPLLLDVCAGKRLKSFGVYCAVMALACLMCAVQWVPVLHVMSQAAPGGGSAEEAALNWSFHPFRAFELLFDGMNGHGYTSELWFRTAFFGEGMNCATYWSRSVYFGAIGFALCPLAFSKSRKAGWVLLGFAAFFLCLAFGKYAGLYEALKVVPLFKPLRYPEKCVCLLMTALSLMAAYGLGAVLEKKASARRILVCLAVPLTLLAILLVGESAGGVVTGRLMGAVSANGPLPDAVRGEVSPLILFSLAASVGALALLLALARFGSWPAFWPMALALAFALQVGSSGHVFTPTVPEAANMASPTVEAVWSETAEGDAPRIAAMSQRYDNSRLSAEGLAEEGRWMSHALGLGQTFGGLFGIESVSYYMPAVSRWAVDVRNIRKDFQLYLFIASLFSATHFTAWRGDFDTLGADESAIAYENPELRILLARLGGAMPRTYLSRPFLVPDERISLGILAGRRIDYGKYATVLAPGSKAPVGPETPPLDVDLGTATIAFRQPEHVAVDVDALVDGSVLVLTDAYYSGWKATVDGAPAEILPANHAVRGVMVPKGKHRVEFTYRTPGLVPAASVSVGTMLLSLCAGLFLWARRRKMHSEAADGVGGKPVEAA